MYQTRSRTSLRNTHLTRLIFALGLLTGSYLHANPEAVLDSPAVEQEAPKTNLINCPDCLEQVSKRALLCPHCGCPGEAIKHAVEREKEAARPKAVVKVINDQGEESGAAIIDNDIGYIVFDVFLFAQTNKLELRDVVHGTNIPYTSIEIAENSTLARLRVQSDAIAYIPLGIKDTSSMAYLDASGFKCAAENATLGLSAKGRATAIHINSTMLPLHQGLAWKSVQPKALRTQLNELARLKAEQAQDASPTTEILSANWLTPYFAKLSESLTR